MNRLSFKSTFSLVFAAAVVSGLGDGLIPIAFALQAHRVDSVSYTHLTLPTKA